ncbi:hypothetical protein HS041_22340 [Planomonospora sp. ID67723]|uniref:hypothetical protein n=1 Tax=Planomonospora sp. ID67723 TaxID=2738134 RepID=UPI0018C36D7B|nr:hypothetical protein [Planomonospora sp. ID67723]MBG0830504.1 hypothetical protein [Planomonospora sp. ID67723]
MARHGRGHPTRPFLGRPAPHLNQSVGLPAFEIEAEFPPLTVTTPDAWVSLPAFEIEAEFPALSFSYGQTVSLPAFEIEAEFPPLTVTTPILPGANITGPGQIEWNGFLLGSGTPYRWRELTGWKDLPGITSGNVSRPTGHGSYPGRPYGQERIINFSMLIKDSRDEFEQTIEDLEDVTGIPESEEELPLVVRELSTPYLVYAQIRQRTPGPIDKRYRLGLAQGAVLQWVASDPRRYGLTRNGVTVARDVPTELLNAGNTSTHPLIRIEGPVETPTLTNTTLNRVISFGRSVLVGETLEIDPVNATARIGDTSVMDDLAGSVPVVDFVLAAGTNAILFEADSGGDNGADFLWRDART